MHQVLIEACLCLELVVAAKQRGFHADHVNWLGRSDAKDWTLTAFAVTNDYAFVTNNRRDFLREYAKVEVHDGLVVIVPMVEIPDQVRLFGIALDHIATLPDTVNKLVEVFSGGEVRVSDWSAADNSEEYRASTGREP